MFDVRTFVRATMSETPTRRHNKDRSGRANRKSANGRKAILDVGEYSANLKDADGRRLIVCKVVPAETGMRNGKPWRF